MRDRERWPNAADVGVPLVTAAALLPLTHLVASDPAEAVSPWQRTAAMVTIIAACVALVPRRTAPGRVFCAVLAVDVAGALAVWGTSLPVFGATDAVALYSLAVHRDRRVAVLGGLAAFTASVATFLPGFQGPGDVASQVMLDTALYGGVVALGQLRRQRTARHRALAARLAEAEAERRAAAAAERRRLARDLHDVAGHHLSAVVVHSGAAVHVADPDLTRQALTVAADKGREVLRALSGLVAVVGPESDGDLRELLPPLCGGLAGLGVPVSLAVEGRARRLPPETSMAVYRIVQEALTNAVRYAPGAPVRVTVRYVAGSVEATVGNDSPTGDATASLGSGRGIGGMRERAVELGGTLTAGPTPEGGWTVTASLPTGTAAHRSWGWAEVLDAAAILMCVALPVLTLLPPEPIAAGVSPGTALAAVAVMALRAAPLWWRRRAPRTALAALAVITAVCGASVAKVWPELQVVLIFGCAAEMVAVYSVAAYGGRSAPTWPAPAVAAAGWGAAFGAWVADGPDEASAALVFGLATAGPAVALALLPFWAWGRAAAARSRDWEADALATMAARTGRAVLAERERIARGLRGGVLDHTGRMLSAAEAGLAGDEDDARAALAAVTEQATTALTAMRALLVAMSDDGNVRTPVTS